MEVKECFFLSQFWDASEQSGNWNRIGKIHLHEYTGFPLEVFLHPVSGFYHWAAEVMLPFPTVQIAESPRPICIHHERVESAGHRFCWLHRTPILIQKDTGIIFSDRFQEVHEISAIVEQRNRRKLSEKFIGTANIKTSVTQVLCQIEYVQTVHRNAFLYMAAAFCTAGAFETDFSGWCNSDCIEKFIFHSKAFPFVPENSEVW